MRNNRRRNGVQIVIVTLCVCFAISVLGYIVGTKLDNLQIDIAGDVVEVENENTHLNDNIINNVRYLAETEVIPNVTPKEIPKDTAKEIPTATLEIPTATPKTDGENVNKAGEVVNKVTDKFDEFLTDDILPLLTGLATGLMTVLALIVPYIKTLGKLKSTQSAYATVYDEHEKLIGLAKEFDTENVKKDIIKKVVEEVESKFVRYDKALGQVLGQEEIISAQITSLIEGAKLAWKQADGASVVLAKTPTATVVEKQALAIEFLKTMIANELGLKKEELESKMNKELAK